MNLDIFVPTLVPVLHGGLEPTHPSGFPMDQHLSVDIFSLPSDLERDERTHNVLGLDKLHELRVLRVINMCTERDVVDGQLSLDHVAFHSRDFARLVEDILIRQKGEEMHEYQLTLGQTDRSEIQG